MPFFADLPPQLQERVVCSISAAVKYEVPVNIVLAVAEKEGGKPGQWVRNSNGTHDVGPMQFNTAYLGDLARYGITANDVAAAGCYSFDLAAWRLRMHIRNDKGDLWTKAANYHSRTWPSGRRRRPGRHQHPSRPPQRPQPLAACRWPATCPARCLSTLHARGRPSRPALPI